MASRRLLGYAFYATGHPTGARVLLSGVVPISPIVHPHLMHTHGASGF
jgi:hypothetical protein